MLRSWSDLPRFSPTAELVAETSWAAGKPTTYIYRVMDGSRVFSAEGSFQSFSPDGRLVALQKNINGARNVTLFLDTTNGRLVNSTHEIFLNVSPNGRFLATREQANAKIWDLAGGQLLSTIACWKGAYFSPDNQFILTKVFDPAVDKREAVLKLWEVKTGRILASLDGQVDSFFLFSNGPFWGRPGLLATSLDDHTNKKYQTKIWRSANGQFLSLVEGDFYGFSPDGKLFATAIPEQSDNYLTKLWESTSGRLVAYVAGSPDGFSSDGRLMLTRITKNTRVWRVE